MNWNRTWKTEIRQHLASLPFTHFLTFNYKRRLPGGMDTRLLTVRKNLREWNRAMLETLYGKQFPKRNVGDAFMFAAFIEIGPLQQKEHTHILASVPLPLHEKFERNAALLWQPKELDRSPGNIRQHFPPDVCLKRIYDLEGIVNYVTKTITPNSDRILFSQEFRKTAA
ncbi:MAG TPA: hypothetical protein VE959_20180 [Bryobacteraceae bacterium]|nr:hypothetical protein [Bryobacteraceae bacterium]